MTAQISRLTKSRYVNSERQGQSDIGRQPMSGPWDHGVHFSGFMVPQVLSSVPSGILSST